MVKVSEQVRGVLLFLLIERCMTIFNAYMEDTHHVPKQTTRIVEVLGIVSALAIFRSS